eukprot:Skav223705  [mRNA]  locus=scaffold2379:40776:61614:+ [translate_table: standard]
MAHAAECSASPSPKASNAGRCEGNLLSENSIGANPDKAVGSGVAAVRQKRPWGLSNAQTGDVSMSELDTCPICLEALCHQALGVCVNPDGKRSCGHFFHLRCLERVEGANCPQCRCRFFRRAPVPPVNDHAWQRLVAPTLLRRDVATGLKACLELPPEEVDALLAPSTEEKITPHRLEEVLKSVQDYLPAPNDMEVDSDPSDEEQKPGGCRCGRMHFCRGDRVKRGKCMKTEDGVLEGQLGSIVRLTEGSVLVKWDRHPKVYRYAWPHPDGQVVRPASFTEIAADANRIQELTLEPHVGTGLSSAAAEELLMRVHPPEMRQQVNLEELAKCGRQLGEEQLRRKPQLFHRVRLLPDKRLVQQWFDKSKPCQCRQSGCCGGVMWSSRAEKHLGREGMILRIDPSDDTVLVETSGPCECKIWYPRLAVMPVFDPDLEDEPQFRVDDDVECKMQSGWERGVVKEVLWWKHQRHGPVPYTVMLLSGASVFVPFASLIRRATP